VSKRALVAALHGVAACCLVVACAKPTPEPAPMRVPGITAEEQILLEEIQVRDTEIRAFRRDLGLSTDPSVSERNQWRIIHLSKAIEFCPEYAEPKTAKCQDMCSLADHICENAEEICRIADDLAGNSWAEDKCSSAKVSCKDGKKACCDCNGDEPEAEPAPPADDQPNPDETKT
jgi:hypothetical protein